jgi:hypothetical protein
MSTANIAADPKIAKGPGESNTAKIRTGRNGLKRLAGIHLIEGGSTDQTPLSKVSVNGPLRPDVLLIAGNFTSTDEFAVQMPEAVNGNCQRIRLMRDQPAIWRMLSGGTTAANDQLRHVFKPVPAASATQFIVRIVDNSGRAQFAPTCASPTSAGFDSSGNPYVDIETNADGAGIVTAYTTSGAGGLAGFGTGQITINPVQIVRWEITNTPPTRFVNGLNTEADATKYDLIRSYVDADGNVVPDSTEVVAEYAVDFKVAFTVESSAAISGDAPVLTTFGFDDATNNAEWASIDLMNTTGAVKGPQRIRSVRSRIVTRTQYADRAFNITPVPANATGQKFAYRYCVDDNSSNACTDNKLPVWARLRTVTTETVLPNQTRLFF